MMRILLSQVTFTFLLLSSVWAVDVQSLMELGNSQYEKGEFQAAISTYEKVLATEMVSMPLHYNLGCAYFSEKEYGEAILHFEKARLLSPRDADVLHNLDYAKLFLKDRFELPEEMPLIAWFKSIRTSLSLAELKYIEGILFVLLILGLIAYRLLRESSFHGMISLASLIIGTLLLIFGGWFLERALTAEEKHAILLVEEAEVSSAPVGGSSTLFVIHEGTSAEILDATDGWYELRLDDGKTGWIIHEAVGLY